MGRPVIDLTGKTFGEWTVLRRSIRTSPTRHALWHCRCSCGHETIVVGHSLRHGKSNSCMSCAKRRKN